MIKKDILLDLEYNNIRYEKIDIFEGDGDILLNFSIIGIKNFYNENAKYNYKILSPGGEIEISDKKEFKNARATVIIKRGILEDIKNDNEVFKLQISFYDEEENRMTIPIIEFEVKRELKGVVIQNFIIAEDGTTILTEDGNSLFVNKLETGGRGMKTNDYEVKNEGVKISELQEAEQINDDDFTILVQGNATKKVKSLNLRGLKGERGEVGPRGEAGPQGSQGEQGLGWLFGKNVPTNEGKEGELYLQYTTFDVYKKTGGTWQKIDTIKGTDGRDGENGRNISLQKSESHIQWKVNDGIDTWHNLIALSDIKGDKGDKGEDNIGHTHENKTTLDKINEGNLTNWGSAYTHSTSAHAPSDAQKNSDITKAEIEAKLIGNITTHEHNKYSLTSHNHDESYANKSSEHTHANKTSLDKISDEKINQWNSKADGNHTHTGFASTLHNHDDVYSGISHNHNSVYEPIITTKKTAFNKDFGTTEGTVAKGNHVHEEYANISHTHTKANISDFPTKLSQFQNDMNLTSGVDGKEVELQKSATHIQWRYVGEGEWHNLVALDDLRGNTGAKGEGGLGWLFGRNVPTNEGRDGDLYLQYTTFDVYKRTGGRWEKTGCIKGADGSNGVNGKNISLQKSTTHIQWKVNDDVDTWHNLVALEDLKGDKGDQGDVADTHTHENLDTLNKVVESKLTNWDNAYTHSTSAHAPSNAQKNSDITKAEIEAKLVGNIESHIHTMYQPLINPKKTAFNKDFGTGAGQVAEGNHTHTGYANAEHNHDAVYSNISHNHNSMYEPIIATKKTAFNKDFGSTEGTIAKGNHTHEDYAVTNHNHDTLYSKTTHNHNTLYEPLIAVKKSAFNKDFGTGVGQVAEGNHTHEEYSRKVETYTKSETDNKINELIEVSQTIKFWVGTKAEYDVISPKNTNTIYFIKEV